MSEKNTYEVGISSDAVRQPRRIVFITRKTSAKVKEEAGPQLMSFPARHPAGSHCLSIARHRPGGCWRFSGMRRWSNWPIPC